MAKFSKKMGGKEVGDASVYAKPHTMSGKEISGASTGSKPLTSNDVKPSVGNVAFGEYPEAKTSGIKTRGNGAATKGVMARGPMA